MLVNEGIGAADGIVWISQGEVETGVIEVGFSLLDVYGGFKILNETTDIGKIVEPLKNNKGCNGIRDGAFDTRMCTLVLFISTCN